MLNLIVLNIANLRATARVALKRRATPPNSVSQKHILFTIIILYIFNMENDIRWVQRFDNYKKALFKELSEKMDFYLQKG